MTGIVDLAALADRWTMHDLRVLVLGQGALAQDAWTLYRFRGALGHALAPGASPDALADRPCPFQPPCGFALFHGTLDPDGLGPITDRPFTIEADDLDGDLLLTVRLFGMAEGWASEFLAAMVAACRAGLDTGRGERVPLTVQAAERMPAALPPPPMPGAGVTVQTITPIVQKSDGGVRSTVDPASLLSALARRLEALARWQGLRAGWDSRAVGRQASAYCADAQCLLTATTFPTGRYTGRLRPAQSGLLRLPPPPPDLAVLLRLAPALHLGADIAFGAGRVQVWLETDAG